MNTRLTADIRAAGKLLLVFALCFVAFPVGMHAQQYSGTVTGTVTDSSGAAVPGASVTVTNTSTNATYQGSTSAQGFYSVAQLPVGTYNVHIKAPTFKEFVARGVEIHVSSNSEVNAKLDVGAANEVVTVEASAVQVETISASLGEVVEGTQVRELPLNGENFMNLVTLSPGVSGANDFNGKDKGLTGGSDFSVNGNPYTNNLFLVDGVNNNDVGSNRTILVYPSVDAISEFKMLRNSYGPEYGQVGRQSVSWRLLLRWPQRQAGCKRLVLQQQQDGKSGVTAKRLGLPCQRPSSQEQAVLLLEPGVESRSPRTIGNCLRAHRRREEWRFQQRLKLRRNCSCYPRSAAGSGQSAETCESGSSRVAARAVLSGSQQGRSHGYRK
jgi:hypothetical protein